MMTFLNYYHTCNIQKKCSGSHTADPPNTFSDKLNIITRNSNQLYPQLL